MDASVNRIPTSKDDRAYLISVRFVDTDHDDADYSLGELGLLVRTAGASVKGTMNVRRERIDPTLIIGKGKADELASIFVEQEITLAVFDLTELKPAQVRNLEEKLKVRVVGRTEIILDIFARRARSSEAKIQVELAQLKYILPRLKGLGGVLSRLGGGIGTRGPGEKMLETDRRHIIKRIAMLKERLKSIKSHRDRIRIKRGREILGVVAGYTNAGKSTLINLLAGDDLFVEDRLFATLDSFTRSVYINDKTKVLLTDTVGFIRNLPANLVESFRSTLEEISHSDFIIHVIDASSGQIEVNIRTVDEEILKLDAAMKPRILFFNKCDVAQEETLNLLSAKYPEAVMGSAHTGMGIPLLKKALADLAASIR